MASLDAGVVGNVDLNLGPNVFGSNDATPRPHHPAFWSGGFFILAAAFLLFTYLGGFRLIG